MQEHDARRLVVGKLCAIDRLTPEAFLIRVELKNKWYVQIVQDPSMVQDITPTGGFKDEAEARIAYQKALSEGELTPYRALAQRLSEEVRDIELVGGYARVLIKANDVSHVFMVKPPFEVVSLCDDDGMSDADAQELYNSFPDVLRGWPLLYLQVIPSHQWWGMERFVIGMMHVTKTITLGSLEAPVDRIWIFAWRVSDGEVRFLPPEPLDEVAEVFAKFQGWNMKKVFERPSLATPPAFK